MKRCEIFMAGFAFAAAMAMLVGASLIVPTKDFAALLWWLVAMTGVMGALVYARLREDES